VEAAAAVEAPAVEAAAAVVDKTGVVASAAPVVPSIQITPRKLLKISHMLKI